MTTPQPDLDASFEPLCSRTFGSYVEFEAAIRRSVMPLKPAMGIGTQRDASQARHERGVKLIAATAHYVTAELDDSSIIDQDVVRVAHRQSARKPRARRVRDVEYWIL
jgi:folate-dependent phosphoribosylglycinamide formyltransferase PurN